MNPGTGGSSVGSGGAGKGTGGVSVGTTGGVAAGGTAAGGSNVRTGGATGNGGTLGTGGAAGPAVTVSSKCKAQTWPTATGSPVTISGTMTVTGVYDGKMALHEGTLNDCSTGNQSSTTELIEVADGGTVKNIVFGTKIGDGIHCAGTCTIDNVWFPYICDDAITMLGGAGKTATIQNSGFKGARDKTIQHNGDGSTVILNNIYVETAGKLYRSCGQGCSSSAKRTVKIDGVVAIGVGQVAGISTNDSATLANICAYRTPSLCRTYQPGSENETTIGANATDEGPSANCKYVGTDTHALVDRVVGAYQTDVLCTGPNSVKVGATATACVPGFDSCLKGCAPGSYGFKQAVCSAGKYMDSGGCGLPADPATAPKFAGTNSAAGAATSATNNSACTTQWAWGNDGAGKSCMCVMKPGYYQASSGWYVWDCQSQWW